MWYGLFYYFFFSYFFISFFFYISKIIFYLNLNKNLIFQNLIKITFFFLLFFFLIIILNIYHIYLFYNKILLVNENYLQIFNNNFYISLFNFVNLNLVLINIYYFPYIYIFILITILSILFCLNYNFNELIGFIFYCKIILIFGYMLFFSTSLILFFLSYEMLLIPSFFILYKFAKTRRCIEAGYLMFFWTQFGALFLIFSFIYLFFITKTSSFLLISYFEFSQFEINFFFVCWIFGFGVKLPIWPFYGWLPKAHVEASTNFSIFLSGVLVKFAFFGLFKCLLVLQNEPTLIIIYPFLTIGIIDAIFKLFYQIDLKKLIAYSTVIEMHWLTICVISGQSILMLTSFCMLISHAFLSSNSFLLVDAINRRFKTRLITEINGINFLTPKLFLLSLLNCLIFLGFPGSIFFIAEFLFFSFFFDFFPFLSLFLLFFLYLLGPSFFFRSWMNTLFGLSQFIFLKLPLDINIKEFFIYFNIILIMFWLGFSWQLFIF